MKEGRSTGRSASAKEGKGREVEGLGVITEKKTKKNKSKKQHSRFTITTS